MDMLIDWVTKIIIFLLLASVVDLLIPANAMKKYVNLAMGLILILIFLQPLFHVFDMDVRQALERSFSDMKEERTDYSESENLMEKQKSEIQDSQRAYILEQMAVQLKDQAKDPLQQKYHKTIANIDFDISTGAELTNDNFNKSLDELSVTLKETESETGGVDTVEDVDIDTKNPLEKNADADIDVDGIKQLLNNVWDVDKDKLTILGEGGPA